MQKKKTKKKRSREVRKRGSEQVLCKESFALSRRHDYLHLTYATLSNLYIILYLPICDTVKSILSYAAASFSGRPINVNEVRGEDVDGEREEEGEGQVVPLEVYFDKHLLNAPILLKKSTRQKVAQPTLLAIALHISSPSQSTTSTFGNNTPPRTPTPSKHTRTSIL